MEKLARGLLFTIASYLAFGSLVQAAEPDEGDFYTDKIDSVDQVVNLLSYGADGSDTEDDSAALRDAVADMAALTNGGKIEIPAGTYYLNNIKLRSDVHIEIDPGATIKSSAKGSDNAAIFRFGKKRGPGAIRIVENASIRSSRGRFAVDLTDAANPNVSVVSCNAADNFLIADFDLIDGQTKFSAVTVGVGEYRGDYVMPSNGVVKNITASNQRYGYGVVQMKAGFNILYKNLQGEGGVTLRLESGGDIFKAPSDLVMDEVYARDIGCTSGRSAIMLSPHTRDNGYVDIDRVTSDSCGFAGTVDAGYVDVDDGETGTPGKFDARSVISNVHAVYGETAQLKPKHFGFVPCEVRRVIACELNPDGKSYQGPSAAAILYGGDPADTEPSDGDYHVTLENITQDDAHRQDREILNQGDRMNNCPPGQDRDC